MTASLAIQAEIRDKSGKGISRSLRRNGRVPGVVYGKDIENMLISLPARDIQNLHNLFNFTTAPIELDIAGKKHKVLTKDISLHPVSDLVEHVEFMTVNKNAKLKVRIPIKIEGESKSQALKRYGVINLSTRFIECLVSGDSVPKAINIDIANVKMGESVYLRDITLPKGVTVTARNLDRVILKISGKKSVTEEATAAKPEEAAAATPAPAGAKGAAPAAAAAPEKKADAGKKGK